MKEITEIDMNKYFVLKIDDIEKYASDTSKKELTWVSSLIEEHRKAEGKKDNKYLVLNLDDDIDIKDLRFELEWLNRSTAKVNDIAVLIVNSILKMK